jgi:23S rRNA (adenine-N6)-dimethyltransferase
MASKRFDRGAAKDAHTRPMRPSLGPNRESHVPRPSIRYAQNFLKDPALLRQIIAEADLKSQDVVYEIGPGRGIITAELARRCAKVIAIEIDPVLFQSLKEDFQAAGNIELIHADFLNFSLPDSEYKVFSNVPFNITAEVMRKLLYAEHAPAKAYLILQNEAAEKYSGIPRETQASLLSKPWFSFRTMRRFQKTDFDPEPSVDVVLLEIEKRNSPLVSAANETLYRQFIQYGFDRKRANLAKSYKTVLTYQQWKRLARELHFSVHAQPRDLTFDQWLGIFRFFLLATERGQAKLPPEFTIGQTHSVHPFRKRPPQ